MQHLLSTNLQFIIYQFFKPTKENASLRKDESARYPGFLDFLPDETSPKPGHKEAKNFRQIVKRTTFYGLINDMV